jgi:hypothetical protein
MAAERKVEDEDWEASVWGWGFAELKTMAGADEKPGCCEGAGCAAVEGWVCDSGADEVGGCWVSVAVGVWLKFIDGLGIVSPLVIVSLLETSPRESA